MSARPAGTSQHRRASPREGWTLYFVGLDRAGQEHAAYVINAHAQIIWRATIPQTAIGLADLRSRPAQLAPPATLSVAVERPSGLPVDGGVTVVPVHPGALKASRARYAAARGSDAGDAFIPADLPRTDGHRFRPLQPLSDETRALRAPVRTRDDLAAQRGALANQLRALPESFWPGAAQIFATVDSPIALLPRSPRRTVPSGSAKDALPPSLPGITPADVALSPTCWRASTTLPPPPAARLNKEAQGALVRAFVAVLGPLVRQPQHLHGAVEQAVAGHADGPIAPSLPRAGRVNAAQVLAEPGDDGGSAPTSTSPRKRALPR